MCYADVPSSFHQVLRRDKILNLSANIVDLCLRECSCFFLEFELADKIGSMKGVDFATGCIRDQNKQKWKPLHLQMNLLRAAAAVEEPGNSEISWHH